MILHFVRNSLMDTEKIVKSNFRGAQECNCKHS